MDKGVVFWMIFIISVAFGGWGSWSNSPYWSYGNWVMIILIFLLGWGVYGFAIR